MTRRLKMPWGSPCLYVSQSLYCKSRDLALDLINHAVKGWRLSWQLFFDVGSDLSHVECDVRDLEYVILLMEIDCREFQVQPGWWNKWNTTIVINFYTCWQNREDVYFLNTCLFLFVVGCQSYMSNAYMLTIKVGMMCISWTHVCLCV